MSHHPEESRLALYAGRDLGFLERFRVQRHVAQCDRCRASVEGYERGKTVLRASMDEMPEGLNWDRLAAEMTGNIRVGLAAGECIAAVAPKQRQFGWKPAAAFVALTAVVVCGWWLNFPVQQRENLAHGLQRIWNHDTRMPANVDGGVFLEVNRAGIQFRENGAAMTLMHPATAGDAVPVVVSVSTQGSMRASYIDADTGQVTINNVIAQ